MKKLQQFYIMKISSNRLEKFDYHLKRLLGNTGAHIREIRNNGELIALGDNHDKHHRKHYKKHKRHKHHKWHDDDDDWDDDDEDD